MLCLYNHFSKLFAEFSARNRGGLTAEGVSVEVGYLLPEDTDGIDPSSYIEFRTLLPMGAPIAASLVREQTRHCSVIEPALLQSAAEDEPTPRPRKSNKKVCKCR